MQSGRLAPSQPRIDTLTRINLGDLMSVRSVTPWSRFTLALRLLVAVGLLPLSLVLSGCGSTAQPPTPGTAAETPSAEPTSEPSETQAPTETATPTETESPSPEANPFITEQFKELDAMTLEEFSEQPLELRLAYRSAFFYKFKDPEWTGFVTSRYNSELWESNPLLTKPTLEDTDTDIATQQFFGEVAASTGEFIDSDAEDYSRKNSLESAEKLALSGFMQSLNEMDEQTKLVYEKQVKRIESSFSDGIPGIDALITVDTTRAENVNEDVDGKIYTTRIVRTRFDNQEDGTKWATGNKFVFIEGNINGHTIDQWLILESQEIPTNNIPLQK